MAGRTPGKDAARKVLSWPGVGPAVGRTVGALGDASAKAAPRLAGLYRKLPSSDGLPFGATADTQHRALLAYYARLDAYLESVPYTPTISIVVPTYRPDHQYLREMLASIALQTYGDWQLCIVDDAGGDPAVTAIIEQFAHDHPGRVAFRTRTENGHIAATSNDALALATGDYVALLDHDDRLYPHALAEVVLALNESQADDARPWILYTDERMIDEDGHPIGEVWLKPDWMPLLHLTSNYTNHLTVYDRALLADIGGFRAGFDGSQDHDLMLRATEATATAGAPIVHVASIAYQWRSHPGSVAMDPGIKSYSIEPAMRAVAQACDRRGWPAKVWREPGIVANRIDFTIPEPTPTVAVVVLPAGGARDTCLATLALTTYPQYELLEPDDDCRSAGALVGQVLASTDADYLAVVADDLVSDRSDWLTAMVSLAQLPEVGAVGGLVLDPAGRVAAAGLIGQGSGGVAPAMTGMPPTEHVYLAWPASIHEVLAVSGRAMLLNVAAARSAGGIDANTFGFFGWDADVCLRLREHGLTSVFTPYAAFTEQAARTDMAINIRERTALVRRWAPLLAADPYLNPGLARDGGFRVDPTVTLPEVPPALFDRWLRTQSLD